MLMQHIPDPSLRASELCHPGWPLAHPVVVISNVLLPNLKVLRDH